MNKYLLFVCWLIVPFAYSYGLKVQSLTCDFQTNPLAVENTQPRLSWQIIADKNSVTQTAFRILVADNRADLNKNKANIWDSGLVKSNQSVNNVFSGKQPEPGKTYYWKVQIVDNLKTKSAWSDVAMWRQADTNRPFSWISYTVDTDRTNSVSSVCYRTTFDLAESAKNTVIAEIATPGFFELYINGNKVGKDKLSPAVVDRSSRIFYVCYDVTSFLRKGKNSIAVSIGRGWYGPGTIPFSFRATVPQNEKNIVITSSYLWKASKSKYTTTGTWKWANFGGEVLDNTFELGDWTSVHFDDSKWDFAQSVINPAAKVQAQNCELNHVTDSYSPKVTKLADKLYELDFGVNITGFAKLQLKGNRGDTLRLYYADRKWNSPVKDSSPAGDIKGVKWSDHLFIQEVDTFRYQVHNQLDKHIHSGSDVDVFESKFNYHGFRYLLIEGANQILNRQKAYRIETDLRAIGKFECSDTLLNQMHEVNDRTMRSLFQGGVSVDCPTRERLGYGADGQVSMESSMMNYFMPNFFRKTVADWILRQDTLTGKLPNVAPVSDGGGGIAWGGILSLMSWRSYIYYNDSDLLKKAYNPMMHYLEYIESNCVNGIYYGPDDKWNALGDWVAPGRGMDSNNWPTKEMNDFFNNTYRVLLWKTQLEAARALNRDSDVLLCSQKIAEITPAIHTHFYKSDKKHYVSDEPTYLSMPLLAGIVPDALQEEMHTKLIDGLMNSGHLNTGMLGTYFLIHYLQQNQQNELLYTLIAHKNYPGWGYMLAQGATTWWEQWNGYWSQIHACFTSLDSWFYQGICGIKPKESAPGMKDVEISPSFIPNLSYATASTSTMYGKIVSSWKRNSSNVEVSLIIPVNSSATFVAPNGYLLRSGRELVKSIDLQSGSYIFDCVKND